MKKKKRLEEIFNKIQSYTMWDVVFSNDEFFEDLDTDYNKKEEKKNNE